MPTIAEISSEILSLPAKSRAILADMLLDSLNDIEIRNYDKIWLDEAKRRNKEIVDGKVSCKTHSEVLCNAKAAIR